MSATVDDEDLSLSITPSNPRRNSKDDRKDAMPLPSAPPSSRKHGQPPSTMSKRLNQYDIIRTLGEGSFGKVKLAVHKATGQKVALKIISRQKLVTRDMAGRIEREIQYLQLLRHPHIIKLYTVVSTPREIVMVLEYAGGELFDYIVNHGRLPEDKARKFFQQIVCAVEYCHRHKIVHRDLKPENLLLDENYNVKIADFGLSNIMTDGNFLKTSCGSPNYAAPEVISGKLYAGSEVDVWSCGVILYVLLTGRLPFDDEYIPALFKKIQQGTYNVPNYISKDAARLIKRMLQVNPVLRISIQEIRQDPWFVKDLAEYLQPPVEEFIDTGVDPNKAIDPAKLAPKAPVVVQEKLHEAVVGKLGKTMGYAKDDVQEALAKDEPSAIKDAYLIVRENAIMKTNPSLSQNPSVAPFLAQSPPDAGTPKMPSIGSTLPQSAPRPTSSSGLDHRQGSTASTALTDARSPIHTIGVLPSSLPSYHLAYMQGRGPKASPEDDTELDPSGSFTDEQKAATARRLNPHSRNSQVNLQKVEKPDTMTPLPGKESKKLRPTKWQFGIRSRNSPSEAMLAIFKALKSMGAYWEIPESREEERKKRKGEETGSPKRDRSRERRRHQEGSQSPEYSDSDPDAGTDPEYATAEERAHRRARRDRGHAASDDDDYHDDRDAQARRSGHRRRHQPRGRDRYGAFNDWGYTMPADPWIINARFRKAGMFPPGVAHPSSTHSSRVDLHNSSSTTDDPLRRRSSTMSSNASLQGGATSDSTPPLHPTTDLPGGGVSRASSGASLARLRSSTTNPYAAAADESCWVYVTIQLYCIEKDSYMVDFKSAGYERLARKFKKRVLRSTVGNAKHAEGVDPLDESAGHDEKEKHVEVLDEDEDPDEGFEGLGVVGGEKDINSPFPFMDVASSLIVSLAQRD